MRKRAYCVWADTYSQRIDFRSVTIAHDMKLTVFMEEWSKRFAEDSDANGECSLSGCPIANFAPLDRKCAVRVKFLPLYVPFSFHPLKSVLIIALGSLVAYSRLVMFSFGFQQAYQRGLQSADHIFFTKACSELVKDSDKTLTDPVVFGVCQGCIADYGRGTSADRIHALFPRW
jgi:hypothetical protein